MPSLAMLPKVFQINIKRGKQVVGKITLGPWEAYVCNIKERVRNRPEAYHYCEADLGFIRGGN